MRGGHLTEKEGEQVLIPPTLVLQQNCRKRHCHQRSQERNLKADGMMGCNSAEEEGEQVLEQVLIPPTLDLDIFPFSCTSSYSCSCSLCNLRCNQGCGNSHTPSGKTSTYPSLWNL